MKNESFMSCYTGLFLEAPGISKKVCMSLLLLMLLAAVGAWIQIRIAIEFIAAAIISAALVALTYGVTRAIERGIRRVRCAPLQQLAEALLATSEDTVVLLDRNGHLVIESGGNIGPIDPRDFTSRPAGSDWLGNWGSEDAVAARDAFSGALAGKYVFRAAGRRLTAFQSGGFQRFMHLKIKMER